ncbi:hypothetical protein K0B96_07705 [Horticoccus luteus]|uniref:Uncharacterized protein n=1 Tax=Horticoccus luteus TaxID=2862869 RepID=A0A8F9TYS4_9BACT|nr:hypothetical protein [Horticoccus luteus]QYM80481.1 hypothetical protein K0B96_07705 [Horticoccus luteus]
MIDATLQINLSAGDAAYAELTVPALLAAHPNVADRLLVVDLCKPQRTGIVDPARRYPEPAFSQRAAHVAALALRWQAEGKVDRVSYLHPNDPLFLKISRTYLRPWVKETHDYGGCALMSYLAAFELCTTRWLLHYDADMLLHQQPGFDWAAEACAAIGDNGSIVAAIPRPSPPPLEEVDAPSFQERLEMRPHAAGWLTTWFSTRCYLFDTQALRPLLPLLQGRIFWEVLAAKILQRGYPRSPEIMLFRRMQAARCSRLTLRDRRAWLLHPVQKGPAFVAALPALQKAIAAGQSPNAQRGRQDLDLNLWRNLLS